MSRGGEKLDRALDSWIDVHDVVAADFGASTGGFTDCLLQRGAARVYAIDVVTANWRAGCGKIRGSSSSIVRTSGISNSCPSRSIWSP